MATVSRDDIRVQPILIKTGYEARTNYRRDLTSADPQSITATKLHADFGLVIGSSSTFSLLISADSSQNPFFHKGCSYIPDTDELYVTSDLLQSTSDSRLPIILISKLAFRRAVEPKNPAPPIVSLEWMKLRPPPNMPMPSGAIRYRHGVIYCSQGTLEPNSGGLFFMAPEKRPISIVTNYFGKAFNSVQSVLNDGDGGLWFSDSCAGFEQGIRPMPQLPNHVYWVNPRTGELRVVADELKRPSGLALSPSPAEEKLYVTDMEAARPGNIAASTSAATIYAYDVIRDPIQPPILVNKHVFAFALEGVPAAIVCDSGGIVYAACGDGVEVFNTRGSPIGVIQIPGGCSSLCFGRHDELFICAGKALWRVQLQMCRNSF